MAKRFNSIQPVVAYDPAQHLFVGTVIGGEDVLIDLGGTGAFLLNAPVLSTVFDSDFIPVIRNGQFFLATVASVLQAAPAPPSSSDAQWADGTPAGWADGTPGQWAGGSPPPPPPPPPTGTPGQWADGTPGEWADGTPAGWAG